MAARGQKRAGAGASGEAELRRRLRAAIDRAELVRACREMVATPSPSHQEAAVARVFAGWLRAFGYERVEVDERHNVVARLGTTGAGPSVMVNGHLDHVPAGAMEDPFAALVVDAERWGERGEAIYGRGTCDMKCNLTAAAYAGALLRRAGIGLAGELIVIGDVGEEVDSPDGIQHVIAGGVRADYGLSAESTRLGVYLGHRGKVEFELTVQGRAAHSSAPERGRNAVVAATPLIAALDDLAGTLPADPVLGRASLALTDIAASPGGATAVVPERCRLRIDRRYVRGETPESCEQELAGLVAGLARSDPEFRCDLQQVNHYPLMFLEPEHALVRELAAARAAVLGAEGEPGAWRFGVNGTFMAQAGIPTAGLGPGDEVWAHTVDEHVLVDELTATAEIYALAAIRLCGASA